MCVRVCEGETVESCRVTMGRAIQHRKYDTQGRPAIVFSEVVNYIYYPTHTEGCTENDQVCVTLGGTIKVSTFADRVSCRVSLILSIHPCASVRFAWMTTLSRWPASASKKGPQPTNSAAAKSKPPHERGRKDVHRQGDGEHKRDREQTFSEIHTSYMYMGMTMYVSI